MKLNKILALFLCVALIFAVVPFTASAAVQDNFISEDGLWQYSYTGSQNYDVNGYYIFEYLGKEKNITLPETVDGHKVTAVTLQSNNIIENVIVPQNYIYFYDGAFAECKNLKTVTFSRNYDYEDNPIILFGSGMFEGCKKLQKAILPNLLPYEYYFSKAAGNKRIFGCELPGGIFDGCKKLTEVVLPENITEIGMAMFNGCESLTELTIPEGVQYIGEGAFEKCKSLTTLSIPSTIKKIDDSCIAFLPKCTIIANGDDSVVKEYIAKETAASLGETVKATVIVKNKDNVIEGDLNGDGDFNVMDVTLLQKYIAGYYTFTLDNTDFNGDGKTNIRDATAMQRALVGK